MAGRVGHLAGDEVGGAFAVTGVERAHVPRHRVQRGQKRLVVGAFLGDRVVAGKAGGQQQQRVIGGGVQIHAHLVVGGGHHGAQRLLQQRRADGGVGGVERQHGGHVGGDHAAALADGAHAAGFAAEGELDGVFFFVGVGGHDGLGRLIAAVGGGLQLGGCLGDAPLEGVNDHRLADDAGGGGQYIRRVDAQRLGRQLAALGRQRHAVGGAGVGIAAVHHDGLRVAVLEMRPVHLDGRTVHLVGGEHARGGAAHIGLDDGKVQLAGVVPDARVDARRRKSLGRTHAAGNYLKLTHFPFPFSTLTAPVPRTRQGPASRSCTAPPRRCCPCPGYPAG